jgi:hypothetical protein
MESGKLSGIALSYGLDDRGFESRQGLSIFFFTTAPRPVLGPTQPPKYWVPGAISLGVKQSGCEANHSPPSAEVKNVWSYTYTLQYVFMAWCSVKEMDRDNFDFTFYLYLLYATEFVGLYISFISPSLI